LSFHPADPPALPPLDPELVAGLAVGVLCLLLAGLAGSLRRAMAQAVGSRVLERSRSEAHRQRLLPMLARLGPLSTAWLVLESLFSFGFVLLVSALLTRELGPAWPSGLATLLVSVPILWLVTQALASAVALRCGDALLVRVLPWMRPLWVGFAVLSWPYELVRRGVMRLFHLPEDINATREIVAGLREVVADTEASGGLEETEREIIENVMQVRDVDVAAVMTPRTEIRAVSVDETVLAAARMAAECGFSRLPVYEGNLDSIVGTVSARDLMQALADGQGGRDLRGLMRAAYFVPETKHIPELLAEFRRERIKLAIVLDEYGGTAGMITLGDVLAEIVGDIHDETDGEQPSLLRHLPDGAVEVSAALRVSEVNQELGLDIPEEADYETLGGFVLSELGRFPKRGERFERDGAEFTILEANDRRVLKVRVRQPEPART
jgi:CBS domain containing-hemolysin-like protein